MDRTAQATDEGLIHHCETRFGPNPQPRKTPLVIPRRRYVLVGTGHRPRMYLDAGPGDDWLERPSNWLVGVRSIAVGNESLRTGKPVKIADLGLGDVTRP